MIWREGYETRRLGDLPRPEGLEAPDGTVIILVGGTGALAGFGILVRLCEDEFGADSWRAILIGDEPRFREALPRTRLSSCVFTKQGIADEASTLAAVLQGDYLRATIAGPATEEAWEEIVAAVRRVMATVGTT